MHRDSNDLPFHFPSIWSNRANKTTQQEKSMHATTTTTTKHTPRTVLKNKPHHLHVRMFVMPKKARHANIARAKHLSCVLMPLVPRLISLTVPHSSRIASRSFYFPCTMYVTYEREYVCIYSACMHDIKRNETVHLNRAKPAIPRSPFTYD